MDACCWNATTVQGWVRDIGSSIGMSRNFQAYANQLIDAREAITQPNGTSVVQYLWDGMRILDHAFFKHGLDYTEGLRIPWRRHRQLITFYSRMMYTSHQAELCPGGLLCLDGVNTRESGLNLVSAPYPCPSGSFCLLGSDSIIGTGLCPIGYYCPLETTYPRATAPG